MGFKVIDNDDFLSIEDLKFNYYYYMVDDDNKIHTNELLKFVGKSGENINTDYLFICFSLGKISLHIETYQYCNYKFILVTDKTLLFNYKACLDEKGEVK